MELEKIEKAIEGEIKANLGEFFSYAWRDKIGELLAEESKFARLFEWVDKEIKECVSVANLFCPADKHENYTMASIKIYLDKMRDLAVLVHCRELLLDNRTTVEMRENVEYALCKLFNIHYNENLKYYV